MHEPDENNTRIIQYGPPRCGTTMLWQVLNFFYRGQVRKTHDFKESNKPIVAIYRDFRDSFTSFCRIFNDDDSQIIDIDSLHANFERYHKRIDILNQYRSHYADKDNILWIRYEDVVDDIDLLMDKIDKFLETGITKDQRKEVKTRFSREGNRKVINKLEQEGNVFFSGYDNETLLRSRHIYTGEHGSWKDLVSDGSEKQLQDMLQKDLREWGYG